MRAWFRPDGVKGAYAEARAQTGTGRVFLSLHRRVSALVLDSCKPLVAAPHAKIARGSIPGVLSRERIASKGQEHRLRLTCVKQLSARLEERGVIRRTGWLKELTALEKHGLLPRGLSCSPADKRQMSHEESGKEFRLGAALRQKDGSLLIGLLASNSSPTASYHRCAKRPEDYPIAAGRRRPAIGLLPQIAETTSELKT
ncbi:hypothetical protein B0J12DRAFT_262467 [Macrophomina phaseolina]|uniref:Uncharacterized protein n=1 Tax=Macrophomina phaseolina TaxID=35725 RepID=A0ABQ8FZ56_9PEZI|nr:hypothetical protein B0J12DRAFT_262467 [Macrophomina phaseolina]